MSFFQDLKNAAKDLSEHGLNLDNLQEEVGCEKREPLPALPPTRSEVQTVTPAAEAPEAPVEDEGPGLIENVAALGESVGEKTELMRQKSEFYTALQLFAKEIGVPVVLPSNTPDNISILSSSFRDVVILD